MEFRSGLSRKDIQKLIDDTAHVLECKDYTDTLRGYYLPLQSIYELIDRVYDKGKKKEK